MPRILVRNGHLIDPEQDIDRPADLLLDGGKVLDVLDPGVDSNAEIEIDAGGRIVAPGFVDLGTQLREPGFEEDETIESGATAAVAGGYTSVACSPNTDPPIDSQASVEFVRHQSARADQCQVYVLACVSRSHGGEELAEMGLLANGGAIGFSDAPRPVSNPELMRRALEYAQMFDLPILNQPEVPELNRDGVMHEGMVSTLLGLPGMPAEAEDVMTARDIRLAESTGGRLHLLHVSSSGSCELLRRARARGVRVTAGICALNLALSDEALKRFDTSCKVNPPLRSADHIQACVEALRDHTLDVISTGHAPRAPEKKMDVLHTAPFGTSSLETTLGVVGTKLIQEGHLTWSEAIAKMSLNPARVLGLSNKGTLAVGADADVVVFDPNTVWTVDASRFRSKSGCSPLAGWKLHGRVTDVIVAGKVKLSVSGG